MATTLMSAGGAATTTSWPSRANAILRRQPLLVLSALLALLLLVAAAAPGLLASQPTDGLNMTEALKAPSWSHLLGTDEAGRDIYTRIIHGTRYSLGMALSIVLIATVVGTAYGAAAGFAGGWLDEFMMRIVDVFLAFPAFVLAMAIAASAGRGMRSVVVALAIIWWPGYARMIRGMVLGIRENEWVSAAHALGVPTPRVIVRHILPFTFAELNVRITTDIGYALVAVTSLSFIGLGAQRPTPEWGLLIADGRRYVTGAWWYPIFPGIAIYLTTVVFSLLGDALAERARPEKRGARA
jgi:peptide/nickel transport system permease protein